MRVDLDQAILEMELWSVDLQVPYLTRQDVHAKIVGRRPGSEVGYYHPTDVFGRLTLHSYCSLTSHGLAIICKFTY